ncbi:unnamed protein product [Diplocarpon coronariae]|uniref:DUF7492 domain-containing protein n=1 Tax=Diplocarpon coronariae TaxID=2795749 RepID=A0A218YRR0_9HELO|nr:hypothetical protein B2J93_9125 [Marssonina coronariae]
MRCTLSPFASLAAGILFAGNAAVHAHSWVEQVRKIASNGSYVGDPGYIRNFTPRAGPGAGNVDLDLYLLPPNGRSTGNAIVATDLMCKSNQPKGKQSNGFPALKAAPGDQVALRYLENGHVTKPTVPEGHPAGSGTIFIYGTKDAQDTDTYNGIHRVWNADGTGGDKRGKLIATRPYDDGRCFQINDSPISVARQAKAPGFKSEDTGTSDLLCQNDFQLPTDAPTSGSYTIYWVWEWPIIDQDGNIKLNESYTSCIDISMTSDAVAPAGEFAAKAVSGAAQNGIEAQMAGVRFMVNPTAKPSLAADNIPALMTDTPAFKPAPLVPDLSPAPAFPSAPAPAPIPSSSSGAAISTSGPPASFVTVTVTGPKEVVTVTVTNDAPQSAPTSKGIATQSAENTITETFAPIASASAKIKSSASAIDSSAFSIFPALPISSAVKSVGIPTPTPFLSSTAEVQQGTEDAPDPADARSASTEESSACTSDPVSERRAKRALRLRGRLVEN